MNAEVEKELEKTDVPSSRSSDGRRSTGIDRSKNFT